MCQYESEVPRLKVLTHIHPGEGLHANTYPEARPQPGDASRAAET
jgi:hypothetical protein